jgi:H+/Cl- antiporter ClcA
MPLIASAGLIAVGVTFFVFFIDASVRATILVDLVPEWAGNSSELDGHYRTMLWTLAVWVATLAAGILLLVRTVQRMRREALNP